MNKLEDVGGERVLTVRGDEEGGVDRGVVAIHDILSRDKTRRKRRLWQPKIVAVNFYHAQGAGSSLFVVAARHVGRKTGEGFPNLGGCREREPQ